MPRRKRGETLDDPQRLLDDMGDCREKLNRASGEVEPFGVTYRAIHGVTKAIDAVAELLTGRLDYYYADGSAPMPGRRSWINDRRKAGSQ